MFTLVLAANLFSDAVRDAFDPRKIFVAAPEGGGQSDLAETSAAPQGEISR